ncbi:hypothetical protein [Cryobacterium tagatosivorans]|uniref:Uncharacterized protein n=1 Tax=Cryobacterium tagatosivorans TaxID=1259199 RepID=A0A4R8UEW0_9MICO|nr:hypothetical protein [Cryobacterium tagatosivorans]TFB52312.1 hypothetical protein E3O23_06595 [Cryobacterium tagatosivorans]
MSAFSLARRTDDPVRYLSAARRDAYEAEVRDYKAAVVRHQVQNDLRTRGVLRKDATETDLGEQPVAPAAPKPTLEELFVKYLSALSDWIPAEAAVLYAAAVAFAQPAVSSGANPVISARLWVVAAALAVLLQAFTCYRARNTTRILLTRALLSGVAFAIWSATVPLSAWNKFAWFDLSDAVVLLALIAAAIVFTFIAELATRSDTAADQAPAPVPEPQPAP